MSFRSETLGHEKFFEITDGGVFFQCHSASAELEYRVMIGGKWQAWMPLDRGIGWRAPWQQIQVRNLTGASQTVSVVYHSEDGYFDHRELAAKVALNGVDVQVVGSPISDEGGTVRQLGASLYHLQHTHTVLPTTVYNIVTEAENTTGILVKSAYFDVIASSAGDNVYLHQRSNGGSARQGMLLISDQELGIKWMREQWRLLPGKRLSVHVPNGWDVVAHVSYDIL